MPDEHTLDTLRKEGASDSTKVVNLAAAQKEGHEQLYLIRIGERAVYSHVYSQRVDTSRDEAGRAGTTSVENVREHSKTRGFAKVERHLENR